MGAKSAVDVDDDDERRPPQKCTLRRAERGGKEIPSSRRCASPYEEELHRFLPPREVQAKARGLREAYLNLGCISPPSPSQLVGSNLSRLRKKGEDRRKMKGSGRGGLSKATSVREKGF